ncbi:YadA-like family protein, partial [Veillonella sp. AS16]|uniref:YadA-like family protein n=1 Tax=Veillonella sp. AS16 TaxID=936589 RepID=UPI0003E29630
GAHIMGNNSTVSAKGSMALGNWAYATAMDSFVMGNNARVDQANSVALGTNSTTETVVSTPNATVNGVNKTFAGGTAQGTVSIGANNVAGVAGIKKYYRTLTNLAAGRIDANSTDAINGSQLHAVKEEVERGLNFDANTGGAKNNKLGSKVTIKGDGSNINAAITQANGDTTINMTLGNTVTIGAANPVTINGTTGHVTGLQNKDWNVDSPVAVSGRGATEDQLKKVNDKVNTNKTAIDKNAGDINTNKQNITKNAGDIANNKNDIAKNKQDISTINTTINKGLNFAGDTGAVSNRQLGDTVTVKGGATGTLSDGNIGVESDGNGTLNVKLAKTLTGLDSVTAGNTKIDNGGLTVGGKTYVSPSGLNANNQKITNVADGSNLNDAVNYGQLQKAINGTAKASSVKAKDANVTVTEGTNANGGKEYTVGLGNKITVGTANPVTVDGDTGHVTGLTNTDWNVDNPVAVSGRAATEDQLKKVNDKVNTNRSDIDKNKQDIADNKQNIADNKQNITKNAGDIANNTQNINKNKQDISDINKTLEKGLNFAGDTGAVSNRKLGDTVTIKGGADAAKLSDNNIGVVSDGNGTLNVKLAKELQGLTSTTFTNGGNNTVINGDGMTINPAGGNKVSLTKDGLNNGGNKITNVANGTDPTDAVNKSQLDNATAKASTTVSQGSNITVTPSDNANGSKNYEVSLKDQVTLGKDAGKQVSFDGTNGTIKAGDKVTIDGKDGKIAAGKVAVDGKDGYVTGLENKDWDPDNITSGRAATEDQLQKSHKSLDNKITNLGDEITKKGMNFAGNTGEFHRDLGQKVTIKGEGTESDDKYSGENIKTVAENGNVTIKMAKDLKTDSVTTDKVKVGKNGQDGVSITGPNGADGTDGKVGITGKDGKDAVSMSGKDGVGHIGLTGKDGRNADITVDKGDPDLDGNNITRIKYQDENGKTHQVATKDDGMKYGGDSGSVIKKKLNEQVNVVGGITDASKLTTEDNLGVVSDGTGNLKVRMAKDLKGLETVTTKDADGNTTVMNGGGVTITPAGGNQVSLTKDGLDNGGNTISNVGPGVNGTDAVNVNQLKDATDGLSNAINAVAGETQRVGAHAAALSALKPIQYDPLEPTQVMAGIGNYRGETAAALGVAHYTAEDTMFHVGMSVGGHHNMVNAGVTRKFGTSDAKKAVPERYKGGPISSIYVLQDEVTALKAENARMQESLNELSSVKDDNARMQQRIDELSSVKEDNEQMKAQIALLMQQAGLTK